MVRVQNVVVSEWFWFRRATLLKTCTIQIDLSNTFITEWQKQEISMLQTLNDTILYYAT